MFFGLLPENKPFSEACSVEPKGLKVKGFYRLRKNSMRRETGVLTPV
jgi:hypothetical protein